MNNSSQLIRFVAGGGGVMKESAAVSLPARTLTLIPELTRPRLEFGLVVR